MAKSSALAGKNVIITGEIEGHKRAAANKILEDAGAKIEKSLNKKVNLVVLGNDPGPDKLKKIEDLGIATRSWDEVIADIEVGGDTTASETEDDEAEKIKNSKKEPARAKASAKTSSKASTNSKVGDDNDDGNGVTKSIFGSGLAANSVEGKTIIITGSVPGHDRKSADALLQKAGAKIAKSLNKQVELVVLGIKLGPDKLAKIEEMGIATARWSDVAQELGILVEEQEEDKKRAPPVKSVTAPQNINGKTLLITGTIDGHTRSSAQKLLEQVGGKFAKSLNKQVELVILGSDPGPDKIAKISDLGIPTVKWDDFLKSLNLSGGDAEPPKKKSKKT